MQADNHVIFLTPEKNDYLQFSTPFNTRIKTKPKLVAACMTEIGVQKAIQYAIENELNISVKSGGHCFEGLSLNSDGLVIDISSLINQQLEGNIYITDAGVKLYQAYDFLLPRGRIIPTGSCSTVGLSGLALGGGYGLFSRKWGLTCDNLTRVRMVDGQGQLRDSISDKELLWACRGGGNGNFGVITKMWFATHSAPQELSRHYIQFHHINASTATQLCQKWFTETVHLPKDAFSSFILNGNTLTMFITYFEDESTERVRDIAKSLAKGASFIEPHKNEPLEDAVKHYYGIGRPLHFKNASAGYYQGFEDLKPIALDIFSSIITSKEVILQINTLGGAIANEAYEKKSAYAHRSYKYIGELQSYWESDDLTNAKVAEFISIQAQIHKLDVTSHYRNYPSLEINNWEHAYYGSRNYKRLQMSKQKYDPNNLFFHQQSVRLPD
ncbi:FAD-binding protein [Alteromonadaceae bacterium M269]|nr:FAD-binding protein [Alteromonadaceae bacterium M269]